MTSTSSQIHPSIKFKSRTQREKKKKKKKNDIQDKFFDERPGTHQLTSQVIVFL